MPSDPTTLPSGGAWRSGRNTRKWTSAPRNAAISNASTTAGTKATGPSATLMRTGRSIGPGMKSNHGRYRSPDFCSSSSVYAGYIASAPWAKLMTPEPLNAHTSPEASMAYRAPVASPTKAKNTASLMTVLLVTHDPEYLDHPPAISGASSVPATMYEPSKFSFRTERVASAALHCVAVFRVLQIAEYPSTGSPQLNGVAPHMCWSTVAAMASPATVASTESGPPPLAAASDSSCHMVTISWKMTPLLPVGATSGWYSAIAETKASACRSSRPSGNVVVSSIEPAPTKIMPSAASPSSSISACPKHAPVKTAGTSSGVHPRPESAFTRLTHVPTGAEKMIASGSKSRIWLAWVLRSGAPNGTGTFVYSRSGTDPSTPSGPGKSPFRMSSGLASRSK